MDVLRTEDVAKIPSDQELILTAAKKALQSVKYPGYSRDIISFGFVKHIDVQDDVLQVILELSELEPDFVDQIKAGCEAVLSASPEVGEYTVDLVSRTCCQGSAHDCGETHQPSQDSSSHNPKTGRSPMDDEVPTLDDDFDPSQPAGGTLRPDLAPGVGYDEGGPEPLGGPLGDQKSPIWEGKAPVFQWEIDPTDSSLPYGESEIERDGWMFRLWWQAHRAGLVYASISAIVQEADEEPLNASKHPVGRNVAVNLVYDSRRNGVVAIYGTALDFRPFVEVFLTAFDQTKTADPDGASPPTEKNL